MTTQTITLSEAYAGLLALATHGECPQWVRDAAWLVDAKLAHDLNETDSENRATER